MRMMPMPMPRARTTTSPAPSSAPPSAHVHSPYRMLTRVYSHVPHTPVSLLPTLLHRLDAI